MVEWQEWLEWWEWRNGRKNDRMTKLQKWLHTYYLWYTPTQWRNGVWNGGMVDWREWSNGGNGGNGENGGNGGNGGTAERMAERKWLYVLFMVHANTDDDTNNADT